MCADYPVYHSVYDNYNWMSKYGDPLFRRHVAGKGIFFSLSETSHIIYNIHNSLSSLHMLLTLPL